MEIDNIPTKFGFKISFFSASNALLYIRSTQHNNRWKEFTKSSEIAGKLPRKFTSKLTETRN